MTDGSGGPADEPVGSLGEEAAKLFGVLSEWAREQQSPDDAPDPQPDAQPDPQPHPQPDHRADHRTDHRADPRPEPAADARSGSGFDAAAHTVAGLAEALRRVDEHVATGAPECRYCPLCRMIHVVRRSSPEVRRQVGDAAVSLLEAAVGLLADRPAGASPDDPAHRPARDTAGPEAADPGAAGSPGSGDLT